MASRKAVAKEALERRIEAADGGGGGSRRDLIAKLSSGDGSMNRAEMGEGGRRDDSTSTTAATTTNVAGGGGSQTVQDRYPTRRMVDGSRRKTFYKKSFQIKSKEHSPPLTDHFSGFKFNPTDAEWFGLSGKNSKGDLLLGEVTVRGDMTNRFKKLGGTKQKDAVYFNSNKYLGNTFITADALVAGYGNIKNGNSNGSISSSSSLSYNDGYEIGFGTESLLRPDSDQIILDTEVRLLRCMVFFGSARLAMKSALSNGLDNGPALIEWSSPEREWLFQCLTDFRGHASLPKELQDGGTVAQLRQYFATKDAPNGSFTDVSSSISRGVESYVDANGPLEKDEECGKELDAEIASVMDSSNDANSDELPITNEGDSPSTTSTVERNSAIQTEVEQTQLIVPTELQPLREELNSDTTISSGNNIEDGLLEMFFQAGDDVTFFDLQDGSISREVRAELTVQQTVAVMLRATALSRLFRLKTQWKLAVDELSRRGRKLNHRSGEEDTTGDEHLDMEGDDLDGEMEDGELETIANTLGQKVIETAETVRNLTESLKTLTARLLDYCSTGSVEGRISVSQAEELAKAMESHIASLPPDSHRPETAEDDDNYIFGSDDYEKDIEPSFGVRRSEQEDVNNMEDFDINDILDQDFVATGS